MYFKRLLLVILVVFISSLSNQASGQTRQKPIFTGTATPTVVEQPTDVNSLPIVKWDDMHVIVLEGQDAWLALRTDTPINTTSGIKIDIQIYTETSLITGATMGIDFDPEITLPQTNQTGNVSITGYMTNTQMLYIQLRTISDTTITPEKPERFYVDVIIANGTVDPRGNRATVTIAPTPDFEKSYPAFANWQSCQDVGEPANNTPGKSGLLATSGGICSGSFLGETPQGVDYYQISQAVGGNLSLRLKNTTPGQHDLDLYLYKYNSSTNRYDEVARSTNDNQLDDMINTTIVANTSNNNGLYLVAAYWAVSTGEKIPTYELTATMQ